MSRGKWTLMQWCTDSFKFIPRISASRVPLNIRQRIPSIDKLSKPQKDARPLQFIKLVKQSPSIGAEKLKFWCADLDIDALEEYAHFLMHNGGSSCIPANVQHRLKAHGIFERLMVQNSGSEQDSANALTPISLVKGKDTTMISHSSGNILSGEISELEQEWKSQLLNKQELFKPEDKHLDIINSILPWENQCETVVRLLGGFIATNVHSPFPKSLGGICLKLGSQLEYQMLKKVAHKNGITMFHRQSTFVWGMLNQSPWTTKQHILLGAGWLQIVIKTCKFYQIRNNHAISRPAFWKTWYINKTQRRGVLVANSYLLRQLRDRLSGRKCLLIASQNLPMLVPPRPWTATSQNNGSAPREGMSLIASPSTEGVATVQESMRTGSSLDQIRGLNRLQNQSWRINQRILAVIKQFPELSDLVAIAIADDFKERVFYLPMYMDFRGRCYPSAKIPLNFMTDDVVRSLFVFGDPRELGESGLKWLAVHLANISGRCKSFSYEDRLNWVESNRQNIIQSASNPQRFRWWYEIADKPFQTLAACIDLSNAWKAKDPKTYKSNLPVHLDGSSNGLQHLVALARDERNAPFVNLTSSDCGDVYSEVAKDMTKRSSNSSSLSRKDVKKAVMTYFYGASEQSISEMLSGNSRGNESSTLYDFFSLVMSNMFKQEREIQLWLIDCTKRIMSSRVAAQAFSGASLVWTSPLGLPVVQPYVEPKIYAIRTTLQSFWLPSPFHLPQVNGRKQVSSVNANFVHSLDAAHMLLTATMMPPDHSFSAVHDSFWTHAGSVDTMNEILREAFIKIHDGDLLAALRSEWLTRYRDFMVLANIHSDSPLYEKIIWERNGVTGGERQQKLLETELVEHYEGKNSVSYQSVPLNSLQWQDSKAFVGTPGLPSVKIWVPLQLSEPPKRGEFNLNAVRNAKYFFN